LDYKYNINTFDNSVLDVEMASSEIADMLGKYNINTFDNSVLDVEMASSEIADVPGRYNINTFDNSVLDVEMQSREKKIKKKSTSKLKEDMLRRK
jgi:hypothetical protein